MKLHSALVYLIALPVLAVPVASAASARAGGRAPVAIVEPYRHRLELAQLIRNQSDPGSPLYRQFLTPAQFAAYFAPSVRDEQRVERDLRAAGLHIERRFANRTVIDASGTPEQLDRVLRGGEIVVSNARVVSPARRGRVQGRGDAIGGPLQGGGGYGPLAWAQAYDYPVQHGYDGSGVRVADIVDAAAPADSDVNTFLAAFNIVRGGPPTADVSVDGGCGDPSSQQCVDFDFAARSEEMAIGLAPSIAYTVYSIPTLDPVYVTDAFNQLVSDNAVDVANTWLDVCENDAPSLAQGLDSIVQQGVALGITFVTLSTNPFCSGGQIDVSVPADSPNVLAVSTTDLDVDSSGRYESERAHVESLVSGGGGVSSVFPRPAYQAALGSTNPNGRNLPDVSTAMTVNGSTFALYDRGRWNSGDAIGDSAPLAAFVAEVDQLRGGRLGLVNASIYGAFVKKGYGKKHAPFFHDVTLGGAYPILAGPGYDFATGIGSIDGFRLAHLIK